MEMRLECPQKVKAGTTLLKRTAQLSQLWAHTLRIVHLAIEISTFPCLVVLCVQKEMEPA